MGNLANLERLSLWINQLSGEIPPELGNLANLETLNLGWNQLRGEIPPELGDLANLKWLYLNHNRLSGEIPPELGDLANLSELYLSGNQLSGCVPSRLDRLDMYNSDLGGLPFLPVMSLAHSAYRRGIFSAEQRPLPRYHVRCLPWRRSVGGVRCRALWMPAFAGMTGTNNVAISGAMA